MDTIGLFLLCTVSCALLRIRAGATGYDPSCEEECEGSLPFDLLQERAEIRWYSQMMLFEDDLADFGYVMMECRCVGEAALLKVQRVMKDFFYILQQQYLRIDHRCIYVISHRYFQVICSLSSFLMP